MRATGDRTKRAVVDRALRLLVQTRGQTRIRRGKIMWRGDSNESRRSREARPAADSVVIVDTTVRVDYLNDVATALSARRDAPFARRSTACGNYFFPAVAATFFFPAVSAAFASRRRAFSSLISR